MKITQHFRREEFNQKDGEALYPGEWVFHRLRKLCNVLESLREELGGVSITITSGYRSPEYNRAVGGSRRSQHVHGRAADIKAKGVTAERVHDTLLRLHREGRISIGGLGRYRTWTHVDIREGNRLARWSKPASLSRAVPMGARRQRGNR